MPDTLVAVVIHARLCDFQVYECSSDAKEERQKNVYMCAYIREGETT